MLRLASILAVLVLTGANSARADLLEIGTFFAGGGFTYDGGTAPISGSLSCGSPATIAGTIYGISREPVCSGPPDFTTGPSTGGNWVFDSGGSFEITGSVRDLISGNVYIPTATLLAGDFSSPSVLQIGGFYGDLSLFFQSTLDVGVSDALADLLGIPRGEYIGTFDFYTGGEPGFLPLAPSDPISCGVCVIEGFIELNPVPEPTSLILLASVILVTLGKVSFSRR